MDDTVLKLLVLRELLSQSSTEESSTKSILLDVGLKVVRGPDWKWDNQDGGEGHVGTIVEVGKPGSSLDKQVFVIWDCGLRGNYRIGFTNAYDLRTLENSSIGIEHPTVTCNSCRKKAVTGMRWKCKRCYDYDLCTRCYMSDKHDTTHPFQRIQTNNSTGIDVPKRQGSVKIPMKGIFASAKVVRGLDWKWERQDGGVGNSGIVTDICGWDDNSGWNACHVTWSSTSSSNMYRLGMDGKVDLKYTEAAVDGYYYRDHLPVLGDETRAVETQPSVRIFDTKSYEQTSNRTETKININETGTYTGSSLLSQNLKDLFFSDQFTDLTLKVQDRRFQVHKAIICARSSVFASKVLYDAKNTSILEVTDCEPDTFEDVLYYLYTGKLKRLSHANVNALCKAAEKFNIQALKEECILFRREGLSAHYVADFIAAA